jgi:predicted transcriptional regulator of viral defense system
MTGVCKMTNLLIQTIDNYQPGHIFSAHDFSGLASRNTIDQTLLRLSKKGHIQKIAHGIFNKPKVNALIGIVQPSAHDLLISYCEKFGYKIQYHPTKAANLLGLSHYVPAQLIYLTDAPNKVVTLGVHTITLKHVAPRKLIGIGTKASLIIQSLYYFGKDQMDDSLYYKIKNLLDDNTNDLLKSFFSDLPYWMQNALSKIWSI